MPTFLRQLLAESYPAKAGGLNPKFGRINTKKTLFLSRATKRIVNGLYVTPDQRVSIGRQRKSNIKTMLYKFSKDLLSATEILSAQGMLAFIQDCEPDYYNKLALKYGDVFFKLKEFSLSK